MPRLACGWARSRGVLCYVLLELHHGSRYDVSCVGYLVLNPVRSSHRLSMPVQALFPPSFASVQALSEEDASLLVTSKRSEPAPGTTLIFLKVVKPTKQPKKLFRMLHGVSRRPGLPGRAVNGTENRQPVDSHEYAVCRFRGDPSRHRR